MRFAEHIRAEGQQIPAVEILVDERHIQSVLVAARFLFYLRAVGIQVVHVLYHIGNAVLVVVPFLFPIFGKKIFAVCEHGRLLRDGHTVIQIHSVCFHFIGVHHGFRDFFCIQFIHRQGQNVPAFRIPHQHIVRLVQYVRAIPVGTVLFQINILIHVCIHCVYVILFIFFVEGVQNFLQVPCFNRHLIIQHANRCILLYVAFKLCHQFLIGKCSSAAALSTCGETGY